MGNNKVIVQKEDSLPKHTFKNEIELVSYRFRLNPFAFAKSIKVIPIVTGNAVFELITTTCNNIKNRECTWMGRFIGRSVDQHDIYLKLKINSLLYDYKKVTLESTRTEEHKLYGHFKFRDSQGNVINHLQIEPGKNGFITLTNTGTIPINNIKVTFSNKEFARYFYGSSCDVSTSLGIGNECQFTYRFPNDAQSGVITVVGDNVDNNLIKLRANTKDGQIIVVGKKGSVYISNNDGETWKLEAMPTTDGLNDIVYQNGKYFMASDHGILTSEDGIKWSSGICKDVSVAAITGDGHQLVAVTWNGDIINSEDGKNWTIVFQQKKNLSDIGYFRGLFIAIGDGGTILTCKSHNLI